ncbi:hypothetical protein ACWD4J_35120 [Streptomyces sp. NPDC002577]
MTVRDEVRDFCRLGRLPPEDDDSVDADDKLDERQRSLHAIAAPVTDEEARLLVRCFGDDNCRVDDVREAAKETADR